MARKRRARNRWALVLGATSGFGAAATVELARDGYDVFGLYAGRSTGPEQVDDLTSRITDLGRRVVWFQADVGDKKRRDEILEEMAIHVADIRDSCAVRVLVHSIAYGSLRPYFSKAGRRVVTPRAMDFTVDLMANSLVYWTQALVQFCLMGPGGRVFALTSAGARRVWPEYGPVSAAKAALEAHVRQMAFELAPHSITVNGLCPGVTDTPALRKIPGHEAMIEHAKLGNPSGRLTDPVDVGRALVALADDRLQWMTGNVIAVDGGEGLSV